MKMYDYSGFRLSRIKEPRFNHLLLLGGWIVYFILYFVTENLIPYESCHVVHCRLDDLIPFCEYFVVFYVFWYLFVFGSLAYTLFFDVPSFKKLQWFIMITQAIAMVCYIAYPTIQTMRPETFERNNVFTWVMGLIYAFDTPTGVCPSLHVGYSLGVLSVFGKKKIPLWSKLLVLFFTVMISLSTAFVKQHSMVDVFAALGVGLIAEIILYLKDYWKPRLIKG